VLGGPTAALEYVGTWGGSDSRFASCNTSMKDLAAFFSNAFPCLVLRFIFFDCFLCMRTVERQMTREKKIFTLTLDQYIIIFFWGNLNSLDNGAF
jgi:hypothetical protein